LFGDFEVGKTIVFYASKDPTYGLKPSNFAFEDREPYDESICDKAYPLDKYYVMPNYDEVQADYMQIDAGGNEQENDEEDEGRTSPVVPDRSFEEIAKAEAEFMQKNNVQDIVSPPKDEPIAQERRRRREPEKAENECPFGLKFGDDFDTDNKCTRCPDAVYEKCGDAFDKMQK
jgi:hypothetical protein